MIISSFKHPEWRQADLKSIPNAATRDVILLAPLVGNGVNVLKCRNGAVKTGIYESHGVESILAMILSGPVVFDVIHERLRQVHKHGFGPVHDDMHVRGEILDAALSYAYAAINVGNDTMKKPPKEWPWEAKDWKPAETAGENLIKATALMIAELERLKRQQDRLTK
jgi:hypothetical protein